MGACCSNDSKPAVVSLSPEEKGPDYSVAAGEEGAQGAADGEGDPFAFGASPTGAAQGEGGEPAGEDAEEKARLQGLVNNFAKRAVNGCKCAMINEASGERTSCEYRLDSNLEKLTFHSPVPETVALLEIPVGTIQEIHSHKSESQASFPAKVVESLSEEDKNLFLMLSLGKTGASEEEKKVVCFVEESLEGHSSFLESMRVLIVYARARTTP